MLCFCFFMMFKNRRFFMTFHDVRFPTDISFGSSGGPVFSTTIVSSFTGYEQRNINWMDARCRYNVAYGVRKAQQLEALLTFFRARRGRGYAFRYQDWQDYQSCSVTATPAATDQVLGTGNGTQKVFTLQKTYTSGTYSYARPITKPVAGSVLVAVAGVALPASGYSVNALTGEISLTTAPANGASVTAGFRFDVPARFDMDALATSLDQYGLGSALDIRVVEVAE
jgi:uncharacterized protein (TIGR02217 family)